MADVGCRCPKIDLGEWNDREVSLAGHSFLTRRTPMFFHVPRWLCRDLDHLVSQVDSVRYRPADGPLVLHRDGWFSGELLLSIDGRSGQSPAVQNFQNLFYSRVVRGEGFDAALREMPRFYNDLRAAQVGPIEGVYFWYLSCPQCLIERGPGQVILLARSTRILVSDPCPMGSLAPRPTRIVPCGI